MQVVLARDGVSELRADAFDKGTGSWYNTKLSSFYDDGPAMCIPHTAHSVSSACINCSLAMHGPYSLINGDKDGVWNQYTGDGILQRVRPILTVLQASVKSAFR